MNTGTFKFKACLRSALTFLICSCQPLENAPSIPKGPILVLELWTRAAITAFRPTEIHCKWIYAAKNGESAPFDLILHWQADNTYTAYMRSVDIDNKNNLLYKTTSGLRAVSNPGLFNPNDWYISYELTYGTRFQLKYYPRLAEAGTLRSNGVLQGKYWHHQAENITNRHEMICQDSSHLAPEPPMADEELTVVGSFYDKKDKEYKQLAQSLRADVIHKFGSRSYILSLTNQLTVDTIPANAPVFNQQGQIVGYTQKSDRNKFFAIEILSVHDEILGKALKKGSRPSDWNISTIENRSPSQRYIDLVCHKLANEKDQSSLKRPRPIDHLEEFCPAKKPRCL